MEKRIVSVLQVFESEIDRIQTYFFACQYFIFLLGVFIGVWIVCASLYISDAIVNTEASIWVYAFGLGAIFGCFIFGSCYFMMRSQFNKIVSNIKKQNK